MGPRLETGSPVADALQLGIRVRESGIGIPATQRSMILQHFTEADSSTTRKHRPKESPAWPHSGCPGSGPSVRRRVLLAEDNAVNQIVRRGFLTRLGAPRKSRWSRCFPGSCRSAGAA